MPKNSLVEDLRPKGQAVLNFKSIGQAVLDLKPIGQVVLDLRPANLLIENIRPKNLKPGVIDSNTITLWAGMSMGPGWYMYITYPETIVINR